MLNLNPHVLTEVKEKLITNDFCRVENVFSTDDAQSLKNQLKSIAYNYALVSQNKPCELTAEELASMNTYDRNELFKHVQQNASQGFGFIYGRHFVNERSHSILRNFWHLWNSEEVLNTFSDISDKKIIRASAQATCYDKGHFLTRHNDIMPSEGRVYAYVLGLTESWHPDWGGLLQFYQQDGSPTQSYAPKFNSLVLFDVSKIHSVTYVTPFANQLRLSITGWFRTI